MLHLSLDYSNSIPVVFLSDDQVNDHDEDQDHDGHRNTNVDSRICNKRDKILSFEHIFKGYNVHTSALCLSLRTWIDHTYYYRYQYVSAKTHSEA